MPLRSIVLLILALLLAPACRAEEPVPDSGAVAQADTDRTPTPREFLEQARAQGVIVPDFGADMEWLNTRRPLSLREDLAGRVVLLDFWTYCCINCHHVFPDLEHLEEVYADEAFAVVGVHSAKFTNEGQAENIRQAVLRHGIEHPVVNDDDFAVWRALGARAWPTLMLVGPDGTLLWIGTGEGHRELLEVLIAEALDMYGDTGLLEAEPLPLQLERDQVPPRQLAYPGKLAADKKADRLYIADTAHDRIVVTDLQGGFVEAWGGERGLQDGSVHEVRFNQPQGLLLHEGLLYVADTENHAIRQVDIAQGTVRTIAGTGKQGYDRQGGGFSPMTDLSSPWDLAWNEDWLFIAMAGTHQIWAMDTEIHKIIAWAGDGTERRLDAPKKANAAFAQPSGLATDGKRMYLADSESSSIRSVSLVSGRVDTHVGGTKEPRDLFSFGDVDGQGFEARLQHPLGIAWHKGKLYVADTYNHKIKVVEPGGGTVRTLAGTGEPGLVDGMFSKARFYEPADIEVVGNKLYVADTNNHAIRVVDLGKSRVSTLDLSSVPIPVGPMAEFEVPVLDDAMRVKAGPMALAVGRAELAVDIALPKGRKLAADAPSAVQVVPIEGTQAVDGSQVALTDSPSVTVPIQVDGPGRVEVRAIVYHCLEGRDCRIDNAVVEVPVVEGEGSEGRVGIGL